MRMAQSDTQCALLTRGVAEIVSAQELRQKIDESLRTGRPLRVKAGFDPTAPDLHLGHTVLLRRLRQFQQLGHQVFFLIGDFTGRIGDPSGRSALRPPLTAEEVVENARTYKEQIANILDVEKLTIVYNSQWFEQMPVVELLRLTTHATVAQMLARADFKKRLSNNEQISLLEFMYPLLQGYDSVKLAADVELGGTDQIFNLLVGRDMQRDFGQPQQVVMTMPLLLGTDGVQKMSKSYANHIGINEPPGDMFGKLMSVSDELMYQYYTLLTDEDLTQVKTLHPKEAKLRLAEVITTDYHGSAAAAEARLNFEQTFSQHEVPADIPVYQLATDSIGILELLIDSKLVASRNEARRLIQQGALEFESVKITQEEARISQSGVLKAGKRRFLRIEKR